eukprot:ANDGO_02879.mRNA.1 hypothetical protein
MSHASGRVNPPQTDSSLSSALLSQLQNLGTVTAPSTAQPQTSSSSLSSASASSGSLGAPNGPASSVTIGNGQGGESSTYVSNVTKQKADDFKAEMMRKYAEIGTRDRTRQVLQGKDLTRSYYERRKRSVKASNPPEIGHTVSFPGASDVNEPDELSDSLDTQSVIIHDEPDVRSGSSVGSNPFIPASRQSEDDLRAKSSSFLRQSQSVRMQYGASSSAMNGSSGSTERNKPVTTNLSPSQTPSAHSSASNRAPNPSSTNVNGLSAHPFTSSTSTASSGGADAGMGISKSTSLLGSLNHAALAPTARSSLKAYRMKGPASNIANEVSERKKIEVRLVSKQQELWNQNISSSELFAIVTVDIIEAAGVLAMDRGGTSDTFCFCMLSGQCCRTRTAYKTLHPVFQESFQYALVGSADSSVPRILIVDLYDADVIGADRWMGCAKINLFDLLQLTGAGQWQGWIPIEYDPAIGNSASGDFGSLQLRVSVRPAENAISFSPSSSNLSNAPPALSVTSATSNPAIFNTTTTATAANTTSAASTAPSSAASSNVGSPTNESAGRQRPLSYTPSSIGTSLLAPTTFVQRPMSVGNPPVSRTNTASFSSSTPATGEALSSPDFRTNFSDVLKQLVVDKSSPGASGSERDAQFSTPTAAAILPVYVKKEEVESMIQSAVDKAVEKNKAETIAREAVISATAAALVARKVEEVERSFNNRAEQITSRMSEEIMKLENRVMDLELSISHIDSSLRDPSVFPWWTRQAHQFEQLRKKTEERLDRTESGLKRVERDAVDLAERLRWRFKEYAIWTLSYILVIVSWVIPFLGLLKLKGKHGVYRLLGKPIPNDDAEMKALIATMENAFKLAPPPLDAHSGDANVDDDDQGEKGDLGKDGALKSGDGQKTDEPTTPILGGGKRLGGRRVSILQSPPFQASAEDFSLTSPNTMDGPRMRNRTGPNTSGSGNGSSSPWGGSGKMEDDALYGKLFTGFLN